MEQIYDMLDKAFSKSGHLEGLILHSDQGWQYQHKGYRQYLEKHKVIQSMSRKGFSTGRYVFPVANSVKEALSMTPAQLPVLKLCKQN